MIEECNPRSALRLGFERCGEIVSCDTHISGLSGY
jgi:hypothetical protein